MPSIWAPEPKRIIPPGLRRPIFPGERGWDEAYRLAGLVNGGLVNGGHAMVDGGLIRAAASSVWTPAVPNYVLFFDMDRGVFSDTGATTPATNGSAVKAINDQSGNSHNVSGDSGTNRTYATNALNGHSAVVMNGSQAGLKVAFTLNQPCTIFVVVKRTWLSSACISDGNTNNTAQLIDRTPTPTLALYANNGVGYTNQNTGLADNTWGIVCAIFNGASSTLRVNAGSAATGDPGSANPGGFTIGSGATGGPMTGSVAAVLVYATALSTTDETSERNDINTRFTIF